MKDDNILVETVSKAGYILKMGGEYILTKDQAVFLKAAMSFFMARTLKKYSHNNSISATALGG